MRYLKKVTSWFNLSLYLLMILGGAGDLVLCLEAEGGTRLEIRQGDCCNPSPQEPVAERLINLRKTGPCVSCIDIPLSQPRTDTHYSYSAFSQIQSLFNFCKLPSVSALNLSTFRVEEEYSPQLTASASPIFSNLRSVILLI